jgi:hypothetical protein
MNLRIARPAESDKSAQTPDPKERHLFQEAVPGGACAVCARSKTDPVHQGVELDESPRWGF